MLRYLKQSRAHERPRMFKVKKGNEAWHELTPCQGQHQLHATCRSFSMKQRQLPPKCMPKRTLPLHPRQPGSYADAYWSIIFISQA